MIDLLKLEAERERELNRILRIENREINNFKRKYDREREQIGKKYIQNSSTQLVADLKNSYELLQTRSELIGISEDEQKRMQEAYKKLEVVKDEATREAIINFSMAILPERERERILTLIQNKTNIDQRDIYSYLSQNDKDTCYILTPVNGEENKILTKNLEKRLGLVLGDCRVGTGKISYTAEKGTVNGPVNTPAIEFEPDQELINGFLMYTLIVGNNDSRELARCLINKLNCKEMQPEGFKEAKLKHIVQQTPYSILDYFRSYNLNLSREKNASENRREYVKRNAGLKFESDSIEGRREEALMRLAECGDEITIIDAQRVLGHTGTASTNNLLEVFKSKKRVGRRFLYSKAELAEFIQTHEPYKISWRVK